MMSEVIGVEVVAGEAVGRPEGGKGRTWAERDSLIGRTMGYTVTFVWATNSCLVMNDQLSLN